LPQEFGFVVVVIINNPCLEKGAVLCTLCCTQTAFCRKQTYLITGQRKCFSINK